MNGNRHGNDYQITPEYLGVVYGCTDEQRLQVVDYLAKLHPGRITANTPTSFGIEELRHAVSYANVGAIGTGGNDVKMMNKAKIGFSTNARCKSDARENADMVLLNDKMGDIVNAVCVGRAHKDHLLKLLLLQIPCCVSAIVMVLSQVVFYHEILVTGAYIFIINLLYFPMGLACIMRESMIDRKEDMAERWAAPNFPGTKSMTQYMGGERLRFSILVNIVYQLGAMSVIYYEAPELFGLLHEHIELHKNDPLLVDQAYIDAHPEFGGLKVDDLTDKGQIFLLMFQTFAFLQIFNILNARRPSFKDLNPLEGIGWETGACLVLLLIVQYCMCYVPNSLGYRTIDAWSNLVCLAIGGFSVAWFTLLKVFMRIATGEEDRIRANKA